MAATRTGRMVLPEDPEELRALLHRRVLERARRYDDPHRTPKEDTTPETNQAAKEPQRNPIKQTKRKPKPYRVIRLTGEESRAINEGRLTVEDIKSLEPDRDDDIPKAQMTTKAKSHQGTSPDANTGQVHGRGPDETPAGAGNVRKSDRVHEEDQTGHRQETGTTRDAGRVHETGPSEIRPEAGEDGEAGGVHEEDQTSRRQETCADVSTGRIHDTGPNEAHTGPEDVYETSANRDRATDQAGPRPRPGPDMIRRSQRTGPDETLTRKEDDRDSTRVHGETSETGRVPMKDQASSRVHTGSDMSTGRAHEAGPDVTPARAGENSETGRARVKGQAGPRQERVHETGPDVAPTRAGEDGKTGRVHATDQASSRVHASSGMSTGRAHEAGPDVTPARAGEDSESDRFHNSSDTSTRRVHETGPDVAPTRAGEINEPGRDHVKDPASSRQDPSTDTSSERVLGTGPVQTTTGAREDSESDRAHNIPDTGTGRVHETGPDATLARAEKDETRQVHTKDQTSSRQETGRVHQTGPDRTPTGAADVKKTGRDRLTGPHGTQTETAEVKKTEQDHGEVQTVPQPNTNSETCTGREPHEPGHQGEGDATSEAHPAPPGAQPATQQGTGCATHGIQTGRHGPGYATLGKLNPEHYGARDASYGVHLAGQHRAGRSQARAQDQASERPAPTHFATAEPSTEEEDKTGLPEALPPPPKGTCFLRKTSI